MATRIFVTGPPGVGKTTVVGNVADELRRRGVPVSGFVTEEVREGGVRSGFDLVPFEGARAPLARKGHPSPVKVGTYGVYVENLEAASHALEAKLSRAFEGVVILDEVGPMELASSAFVDLVRACLDRAPRWLATVKASHDPLGLLRREDALVVEVGRDNRDTIAGEIAALLA